MPRISFADLYLSPLELKTDLTIDETGFSGMVTSLMKYLEGLINVLQNNGEPKKPGYMLGTIFNNNRYVIHWLFYNQEWTAIKKEVAIKKQISFNWIMENIIYGIRASKSKHPSVEYIKNLSKYWKNDAIPKEAIESFTTNEILFEDPEENIDKNTLWLVRPNNNTDNWHFKFGPFKIFLSDKHSFYPSEWRRKYLNNMS